MGNNIFSDFNGEWHTQEHIAELLKKSGACDCDVLFIHSDISFGLPNKSLKRNEYMETLFQIILQTGVRTIIYPTFTYSFCNNEIFDVRLSKTSMGSLNEYARKKAGTMRSLDPLLSVCAFGERASEFTGIHSDNSLGAGSVFDALHKTENVKFLFFGAEFSQCFTYLHYVEKMLNVPYCFDMEFNGTVIDWNGMRSVKKQNIFTACEKISYSENLDFKNFLIDKGYMERYNLGSREIAVISEADAYYWISDRICSKIDYFLRKFFTDNDLNHIYTHDLAHGRITHC